MPTPTPLRGRTVLLALAATAALSGLIILAGCNDSDVLPGEPRPCTAEYVPGLRIEIFDSATGETLICGVSVLITDGLYSEQITDLCGPEIFPSDIIQAAYERPGQYAISIKLAGYDDWNEEGVLVTADECHVKTVTVEAALKRSK